MKTLLLIITVFVMSMIAWFFRHAILQTQTKNTSQNAKVYGQLRDQFLFGSRESLGIPKNERNSIWGVLLETGYPTATVTVVSLADGNASIYISNGGGFLGGIGHESIRNAAINTVSSALQYKMKMKKVTSYPLPANGEVIFYLLTDDGVFSVSDSELNLHNHKNTLAPLFDAAQNVITQFRLIDQKHENQ